MLLEREPGAEGRQRGLAIAVAAAFAAMALIAHVGRIAETPQGGSLAGLDWLAPAKLGALRAIQLDQQGGVPAGTEALGRAAMAADPLAYEPFFAVATAGFRTPRSAGSEGDAALLREALRRNPRSRESRVFLLRHAVAVGDLRGAVDQIAALNRLASSSEKLMLGVGQAINTPKLVDEVAVALAPHPELFETFLRGFASAQKPKDIAVRMVSSLPQGAMTNPKVRRLAVDELVRVGAFAEARKLWGTATGSSGLVHSPDFTDASAPPPFNWELTADETGAAERAKGGGISVDYFGRTPGALASQLLTLSPGRYAAKLVYRSEAGAPGAIGLQVACIGQQGLLLDQPLDAAHDVNQALTVTFTIPAGCAGQMLSIAGRPRETRDAQQVTVRRIEIARAQ